MVCHFEAEHKLIAVMIARVDGRLVRFQRSLIFVCIIEIFRHDVNQNVRLVRSTSVLERVMESFVFKRMLRVDRHLKEADFRNAGIEIRVRVGTRNTVLKVCRKLIKDGRSRL